MFRSCFDLFCFVLSLFVSFRSVLFCFVFCFLFSVFLYCPLPVQARRGPGRAMRKSAAPLSPNIVYSGPPPLSPQYNVEGPPARPARDLAESPEGRGLPPNLADSKTASLGGGRPASHCTAWNRPPINYVSAERNPPKKGGFHGHNPRLGRLMKPQPRAIEAAVYHFAMRRKRFFPPWASPRVDNFLKARGFRVAALRLLGRELEKKLLAHPEKSRLRDRRILVFAEK